MDGTTDDVREQLRKLLGMPERAPDVVRGESRYQRADEASLWRLDGVSWWEAPAPRRWHRHWPQTVGVDGLYEVWRCPCGAMRRLDGPWVLLGKKRTK